MILRIKQASGAMLSPRANGDDTFISRNALASGSLAPITWP